MKRLLKLVLGFVRPIILATILCLTLAPIVYSYGHILVVKGIAPFGNPEVRLWTSVTLLGVGCCLLLWVLGRMVLGWFRFRAAKRRPRTVEDDELAAMDKVFERATWVIRKRWSQRGRGLYGLPWFLVLGRSGAGKTSLIENADLRFPIDHEIRAEIASLSESEAAGFANWRVAGNEAVLLDIAGTRFIAHEKRDRLETVLWDRFLANLVRHRPRRPLNGVVLVIDLAEFAGFSAAERDAYAFQVRRTVNDLVERLATRLTVTIAFTKIDQLAGFADFFAALTAQDREALFGFHFLHEGRHTPDWPQQFTSQFSEFASGLHKRLARRLSDLHNGRTRREAFTFSRTLLGLQSPLSSFLEGALSPDKFSTPPLVRGIYFVSTRQENAPRNVFLEAVGQRYDLPEPLYGTSQGASHPYFSTRLFKTAIFPEAGLAGMNQRAESRYRRRALATLAASLTAIVSGWVYWAGEYRSNLAMANNVLSETQSFARLVQDARNDPTGRQLLTPLNAIQSATLEFADFRGISPLVAKFSLYQGGRIGPIADAAYRQIVSEQFAPVLVRGVGEKLRSVCPKGSDAELDYLRVYRMLGDLDGRDPRVIDKYFRDLWQSKFEADAVAQAELQAHLTYMLSIVPEAYAIDDNLVRQAQSDLSSLSAYQRVYASLRALAERQLPNPVDLQTSVGTNFAVVYAKNEAVWVTASASSATRADCAPDGQDRFTHPPLLVPRLFTREGFLEFFAPQNAQVARVSAGDLWVLGQLEDTQYSEDDYARIQENLRDIYADDYVRTWRRALNDLRPRDFADIRDATEVLKVLSSPNNPMRRIAEIVSENAQIYEPEAQMLDGTEMVQTELPFDPDRAAALRIYGGFDAIDRMTKPQQEGAKSNMDQIEEALAALHEYVKSVRDAPDPRAKALELAIKRAELTGEDPIFLLNRIAERTPAPFDAQLRHVASEAWRVIMVEATEELNRKWHDEIYGDFQRLIAGRYPFRRSSELDLPVEDFTEFFRPGGILETFYKDELLIFVDETSGEPRLIDGQSLAVDADFAARLRQAIEITRTFFDEAGELSVEFSVTTGSMSANISRAVLNVEGQVVVSSHGPSQPITIVWPNVLDGPRASRIDISPLAGTGNPISQQYDGPWSWLRLYDNASKSNLSNNSVDISFSNGNDQSVTFRLRPESRVNPFFNSPLSDFELPSHLRSVTN
jgi:type VI secretion system protein ImpL